MRSHGQTVSVMTLLLETVGVHRCEVHANTACCSRREFWTDYKHGLNLIPMPSLYMICRQDHQQDERLFLKRMPVTGSRVYLVLQSPCESCASFIAVEAWKIKMKVPLNTWHEKVHLSSSELWRTVAMFSRQWFISAYLQSTQGHLW